MSPTKSIKRWLLLTKPDLFRAAAVADHPAKGLGLVLRALRKLRHPLHRLAPLSGDRDIEWSWIAEQMPSGPGEALDFGCAPDSTLALIAARRGFHVTAVDLELAEWARLQQNIRFVQGDILTLPFPSGHFDLVINCSSVEHVGLAGRYGITAPQEDGDLEAMARLFSLLKPNRVMLLTIPVGRDAVFPPLHRVYGAGRLPQLLRGFLIEKEQYWLKNPCSKLWEVVSRQTALEREPERLLYGLGCFVLGRKDE